MASRMKICNTCNKRYEDTKLCECEKIKKREYQREYQRLNKDNPLKTARWTKLRKEVLKRDGHLCQRCLLKFNILNSKELQGHHIKSRKNYPELVFEKRNVLTLCGTCNRQLGTSDKLDFEFKFKEEKEYDFY